MEYREYEEIKKKLKKELDDFRYEHTIGVAYTAAAMAMAHGIDMDKAYLAGLLHDCAKCIPDDKKIKKCIKHDIAISEVEMNNPYLLHSKLGAYIAEKKYGVTDEEILTAITFHTTGNCEMSPLSQIIFIADYIEPLRNKAEHLDVIRKEAYRNLDRCTYMVLKNMLAYLGSNNSSIDETTVKAYNYYKELVNED